MLKILVLAGAVLVLSACAGTVPTAGKQGFAGVTHVEMKWCAPAQEDAKKYLCGAEITDGKQRQDVTLEIKLPGGGEVKYSATAVEAFEGQELRAAVEAVISADMVEIIDRIVEGVTGSMSPLPLP